MSDHDRFNPPLADLIATVRDFLRDGHPGYEMQVARYLLDMSVRELESGAALDRHSGERLASLLRGESKVGEPVASLSRLIRAGRFDDRWQDVLAMLVEDVAERVAIIRPEMLAPEHARRARPAPREQRRPGDPGV